jgi:hypothetical protein
MSRGQWVKNMHKLVQDLKKSFEIQGVNFTNIFRAAFWYKSFFVLAVKVKLFIAARILAQMLL